MVKQPPESFASRAAARFKGLPRDMRRSFQEQIENAKAPINEYKELAAAADCLEKTEQSLRADMSHDDAFPREAATQLQRDFLSAAVKFPLRGPISELSPLHVREKKKYRDGTVDTALTVENDRFLTMTEEGFRVRAQIYAQAAEKIQSLAVDEPRWRSLVSQLDTAREIASHYAEVAANLEPASADHQWHR